MCLAFVTMKRNSAIFCTDFERDMPHLFPIILLFWKNKTDKHQSIRFCRVRESPRAYTKNHKSSKMVIGLAWFFCLILFWHITELHLFFVVFYVIFASFHGFFGLDFHADFYACRLNSEWFVESQRAN